MDENNSTPSILVGARGILWDLCVEIYSVLYIVYSDH